MANGRLRIGYGSQGSRVMIAEYGFYTLTGQETSLIKTGTGSSFYYAGPIMGYLSPNKFAAVTAQGTGSGNSEANAMTLTAALASATAGDIIGVLPGVYIGAGQSNKTVPAWRINTSGNSSNPIIVVAKYSSIDLAGKTNGARWTEAEVDAVLAHPNRTEFRHTGVSDGAGQGTASPSFGVNGPYAWQYWIGMCCDQLYNELHEDGGVTNLWGAQDSKIMRCVIRGRPAPYAGSFPTDNHCGVRCEDFDRVEVSDCVIYNFYDTVGGVGAARNHCGIQRYSHSNTHNGLILRHNYVFGCFNGIFLKDESGNQRAYNELIEWNYCTDNQVNLENANANDTAGGGASARSTVQHNLLVGGGSGLTGQQGGGRNQDMIYNTIVVDANGTNGACIIGHAYDTGCTFTKNICYGTVGNMMHDAQFRNFAPVIPSDNNVFYSANGFRARFNGTDVNNSNGTTGLNSWKSSISTDTNSIFGDPLFTNRAAHDYTLQVGSPARTAGPGGTYVGAINPSDPTRPGPRYAAGA